MELQQSFDKVRKVEHLADTTIVVIGMLEMGYDDIDLIAKILHRRDTTQLVTLLKMLEETENPVVRRCMDVGLPPGVVRQFPYGGSRLVCPLCRNKIDHAPCLRCSLAGQKTYGRGKERDATEYDSVATPACPGTNNKVATLARRAELGLSLFHPEDRRGFDT